MKRSVKALAILFVAITWVVAGCSSEAQEPKKEGEKLTVYASVYPLADFAQKIGGDQVEVINIVPTGVEPHDFEPTAKDLAGLSEADVFLYNGAGFEGWVDKAKGMLDQERTEVVDLSKNIDLIEYDEHGHDDEEHGDEEHDDEGHDHDHDHDHDHGDVDPHVWLDPNRAKQQAEAIRTALIKKDPDHQQVYEENYQKLEPHFDELDAKFKEVVKNGKKDTIIVSHDAFSYLADRYGFKQVAISGLSPSDEPSAKKMKEIVDTAKEHDVNYIFFETLVSGKVAEAVKNEVGAEALILNPLEGLTKDQEQDGQDYFSLMEANADNLAQALDAK